ncbi:hypothetical protein ACSEYT_01905 [Vibrio cidicii]|uniref:hypothetical protein n=1 Tax=Vibrio cidicii TaxID=1763883 RepID=UPI003F519758
MKYCIALVLMIFSFNSYSLGGYGSLTDVQQKTLESIVKQLGISDNDNKVKEKIYNRIDYVFKSQWNSYWIGLNELSASKYTDGLDKGYVDISFNSANEGTLYFTFVYKPEAKQIILSSKQVRHTTRQRALEVYEERKAKTEEYKLVYESDNYALLQEKGKVSFEYYHVDSNTASLVYSMQHSIDL